MQALVTWVLDGPKSPPRVSKRLTWGAFLVPFQRIWGTFCLYFGGVGWDSSLKVCLRLLEDYVAYLICFLEFPVSLSLSCLSPFCLYLSGALDLLPLSPSLRLMQLSVAYPLDCCVVEATRSVAEDHISFRQLCWLLGLFLQLSEHWWINSEIGSM